MNISEVKEKFMGIVEDFFEKKALEMQYNENEVHVYIQKFEKILNFIETNHEKIEWFISIFVKYKFLIKKLSPFKK